MNKQKLLTMNTTQKLSFPRVYNRIKRDVNFITQSSLVNFRDEIRTDAQRIVMDLKPDIEKWIEQLKAKEVSCAELYCIIQQKKDDIEITALANKGVAVEELFIVKNALLQLITNTIINSYLNSLFENQKLCGQTLSERSNSSFFG